MKKILIVFFGNFAHDSRSFKLLRSLSKLGHTTKIICAYRPGEKYLFEPNVTYIKIKNYTRALWGILSFYVKSVPQVLREKADVVICSDLFSLPIAWLISWKNNAKLIYDAREFYSSLASTHKRKLKQALIEKFEKFFALKSDLILTVNKSISGFLSKKFYNKPIRVLHNFPEVTNRAKTFTIPNDLFEQSDILLLYLGLFHLGRGLNLYLKLLENLHEAFIPAKLLLLGKGELKKEVEGEIKKRKLEKQVFILGPYSPNERIMLPVANKVIGLCIIEPIGLSYFYSLPNKIFEYMWHQIPFIASDFPEIRKIVERYKVGILVNPEDFKGILSAALLLIKDNKLYETLKQNCKIAMRFLNWENEIEKFHKCIENL